MNSYSLKTIARFIFSDLKHQLLCTVGLFCFTLLHTTFGLAQIVQANRYELYQKRVHNNNIISIGEEGLAVLQDGRRSKNNKLTWEIVLVDTTLQEKNKIEFNTTDQSKYVGHHTEAGRLFLLFRPKKSIKSSFELIEITLSKVEVKQYTVDAKMNFEFTHFTKVGNSFVFGGYSHDEPVVFLYNVLSKSIAIVPTFFQSSTKLLNVLANNNQTFNVITIDRALSSFQLIANVNRNFIIRTYNQYGTLLFENTVPIDKEKALQVGITSTLGHENLFTFGTWGSHSSDKSFGFFSIDTDPAAKQTITYYDFGELNHYLDYLDPISAEKIKEASQSKNNPEFRDYVMPYKVVEYENGYLLLAEAFTFEDAHPTNPYNGLPYTYPSDHVRNTYNAGYYSPGTDPYSLGVYRYGRAEVQPEQEVKKNETILISFDSHGKLIWDYGFNLNGIRIPNPTQISDFVLSGDRIVFITKDGDRLNSKSIELHSGVTNEISEKIKSLDPQDEVKSLMENEGTIRNWYRNTFYVWGYQIIKNSTKGQRARSVLFINKIVTH